MVGASGRVTLNDVAAASGVSRSTAGFVLSDAPGQTISAATRDRVRQAARELGYVPHGVARALREGSSRVVVLEIDRVYEGNYSRSYIRGLDDELAEHDHALLVRHGPRTRASTEQILHAIAPRAVLRFAEPYLTGHDLEDGGGDGATAWPRTSRCRSTTSSAAGTPGSRSRCPPRTPRSPTPGTGSPWGTRPRSGCRNPPASTSPARARPALRRSPGCAASIRR